MIKILFSLAVILCSFNFSNAQVGISTFFGQWNQSDGKVLTISPLSNDFNGTRARYDYGTSHYYNSTYPTPDNSNYVIIWNATNNTITFRYIYNFIAYINYTQYNDYIYTVNSVTSTSMSLTKDGETITFTKGTLGVSDNINSNQKIVLAENPVKNELKLKLPKTLNEVSIKIFSLDGKLIKKTIYKSGSNLDVSDLSSGSYILNIQDENMKSIKFIKK